MNRAKALELLGLDKAACDLTPDIITKAFRRAVVASHPDTAPAEASQGDSVPTRPDMDQLKIARKMLQGDTEGANNACIQCRGRGSVRHKLGVRPCGACKGTGDKYGR